MQELRVATVNRVSYEQGDLQQEEPKRVKKRQPPRRKLRVLLIVIAAVLTAVAAFVLLPEMFEYMVSQRSHAEVYTQIASDAQDVISMLFQTGMMLNCANVTIPGG